MQRRTSGPARHTTSILAVVVAVLLGVTAPSAFAAGPVPVPLREPLTQERFYFVMADRFANGDPSNDRGGLADDRLVSGFDPTDKGFYHGGDLRGVIEKLDYIAGLGTTAIWLTPSFVNRPVQGSGADVSAGYHGYWITDFTRIDPHLGSNEEMRELIDAAHAKGMKVFFDIITNHTADVIGYEGGRCGYVDKSTRPYTDASGRPFDDTGFAAGETFPALDPRTSFPYVPVFRTPSDAVVKVPEWLNDPTLYHNRGDSTFQGESSEYGDFVGLDDLFTEQPRVRDGMAEIYRAWVAFGIDGFRIDTVKHVNIEFWQRFAAALRDEAVRSGNPGFFAFGEVFDADPAVMSRYTTEGRLQATLDFGFQQHAVEFANGGGAAGLAALFAGDDHYTDADSNAHQLPTFLGNHDMGRVGMMLSVPGRSAEEVLARDRFAHSLMYVTRGQPVVYYGDEQGFTGAGGDKDARHDMFASRVASYNADPVIGGRPGSADRYDVGAPLYRHIAELAALRAEHPVLADGAQVPRLATDQVFAVSRIDRERRREYVVVANGSTAASTVTVPTYTPHSTVEPLWGASPSRGGERVRTDAAGGLTTTVAPLSVQVWKLHRPMPQRDAAPAVAFVQPDGSPVTGRAEIALAPGEPTYAEITVDARVGDGTWQRLGTDDASPYRVFHDVSGLAPGSEIEYRAELRDASGNTATAGVRRTVAP